MVLGKRGPCGPPSPSQPATATDQSPFPDHAAHPEDRQKAGEQERNTMTKTTAPQPMIGPPSSEGVSRQASNGKLTRRETAAASGDGGFNHTAPSARELPRNYVGTTQASPFPPAGNPPIGTGGLPTADAVGLPSTAWLAASLMIPLFRTPTPEARVLSPFQTYECSTPSEYPRDECTHVCAAKNQRTTDNAEFWRGGTIARNEAIAIQIGSSKVALPHRAPTLLHAQPKNHHFTPA